MPPSDPTTDLPTHAQLVAGLVRHLAAASPGVVPEVVQTHISTVILAGEAAYKLKKPVRLPFLDFSTLAQRHFFCEEELRINRRTAPQLYLDVLPVTGTLEAPVIGGQGAPVEWLLHMRRFDGAGEFKALATAGRLQAVQIDALAAHLAAFHLGLPPVDPVQAPDVTPVAEVRDVLQAPRKDAWHWAAASLDEIAADPLRPASCTPEAVAAVRAALGDQFTRLVPLIALRRAAGFERECHGDLHLGNLVDWQGTVLAFDAIEFDASLRCIDIVNDVAFTFMDLLAADLPALAWRFINAWAEATGDYEGLVLLRAFAAGRALVRAKVALLSGGHSAGFARYWALAERLVQPLPAPRLVLTMGLSGSGKSTVAQFLAEALGAVRVRSDVERKRLHGLAPTARPLPGSGLYARDATVRTYARLATLAEVLLAAGLPVVLDAAFLLQDEREALRQLALRLGVPFALVRCVAPDAVMRARIVARTQAGADPSDATPDVLDLQQRVQHPVPGDWAPVTHDVVNDGTLKALEDQVRALAATWRRQ